MFEKLFKRPYYVNRHVNAPFLQERLKYLQFLTEKGVATQRILDTAQYLLRIIEFLALDKRQVASLKDIDQAAEKWARYQSKHPQKRKAFSETAKQHFINHAIHWLQMIGKLEKLPEENHALITRIFSRGAALRRHANAPLLKERILYLQYWESNGSATLELKGIEYYLLLIMKYLNFHEIRTVTENEIQLAANRWARVKTVNKKKSRFSKLSRNKFIRHATFWFEMLGCLEKEIEKPIPFESYLNQYLNYARVEKGIADTTIKAKFSVLKDFLMNISRHQDSLENITPVIIDTILTKKYERDGYCRKTIQYYASVIRSFLKYSEGENWCKKDLSRCIIAVY